MKNKFLRLLTLILTVAVCCTEPTPFYASTNNNVDSNTVTITSDMMTDSDIALCDAMINGDLKDGDTIILKQSPSETLYVTVEDNSEITPRSISMTTIKTFTFTQNILGTERKLFKVDLTCYWTRDGKNSKLHSLTGTYDILHSSVSCSWDDSYNRQSSWLCNLGLDVKYNYGVKSGFLIFYAEMNSDYNSINLSFY